MTRRQPPLYTEAAPPPRGPARAIWEMLSGKFDAFTLQWRGDVDAFAVEAADRSFRLSQHAAIAADELDQLFDGRLAGGNDPRAMRALVAALDSWRTTDQVTVMLSIPKRLTYDRLGRALRLGLVEGRPVAGHAHRQRPAREWRAKAVAP